MHKLERPQAPNAYTKSIAQFLKDYPPATGNPTETERWEAWKNECKDAYTAVIDSLHKNQFGLCAFCEVTLSDTNRQIEHFMPKSLTTASQDWTMDFSNYTLACKGNENKHAAWYSANPSHKANMCCGHKKGNINPVGCICNPYDLPPYPVVRADYREEGLWLVPDTEACQKANLAPELVASTLELLGLNCPNLLRRRQEAWNRLLEKIDDIFSNLPEDQQQQALQELAEDNVFAHEGKLEAFYTTRLLCLASDLPELIQG